MNEAEIDYHKTSLVARFVPRRKRWIVSWIVMILLSLALVYAWFDRETIADNLIAGQLDALDLPARYDVVEIGPNRQVISNVVIGDPARPDLTIKRVEVAITYGFGGPRLGRIKLIGARLYGSLRGGKPSFGSLDGVLFAESDEPPALPEYDIELVDARGLIESDYGAIGLWAEGQGLLSDGFAGKIAAIGPLLEVAGCRINRASAYGALTSADGQLRFDGPLRMGSGECREAGASLRSAGLQTEIELARDFSGFSADGSLATGALEVSGATSQGVSGPVSASFDDGRLGARFDLAARALSSTAVIARRIAFDGSLRMGEGLDGGELRGEITGEGVGLASQASSGLASLAPAVEDTLLAPLLARLRGGLARELTDADFAASLIGRMADGGLSVTIPRANLARGNAPLLTISRGSFARSAAGATRLSGDFRLSGRDLPQIAGRAERGADGLSSLRLRMEDYAAGDSRLGIAELLLRQTGGGGWRFSGLARASGPLPWGFARGLELPLEGGWTANGELVLGDRCTPLVFKRLAFANLELDGRRLTLCPPRGGAIVRYGAGGLKLAAGAPSLQLTGSLAGTPVEMRSGAIGFALPGVASARQVEIALGPEAAPSRFVLSNLTARLGEGIAGQFEGADVTLAQVPLDLKELSGDWSYAGGVLRIGNAGFRLVDRMATARFAPLATEGAVLTLEDGIIHADARLQHPASGREIAGVSIVHRLANGIGHADLNVAGLRFDPALQPDELTPLAYGIVANVRGLVTGKGRIDWNADAVTSSGRFATQGLDLAAAFGPVTGISGAVEFSDLLALTTRPGQQLRIASINPGIEAKGGSVTFSLTDATLLEIADAGFPFLGGTLDMEPVALDFSHPQQRRYVFAMRGIDAAEFVQSMEVQNIAATGRFDGTLPLVFDAMGNGRIENGRLVSQDPGGNVSYVGELTYEDMGAIANFAFTALRSLDYRRMEIEMNGPLTGEIVTNVRFEGISQGSGASSNFLTRRIAKLPIRFNVNVRASFYELFRDVRSLYDPAMSEDPRTLGLIDSQGRPIASPQLRPVPGATPAEPAIQTPASENKP